MKYIYFLSSTSYTLSPNYQELQPTQIMSSITVKCDFSFTSTSYTKTDVGAFHGILPQVANISNSTNLQVSVAMHNIPIATHTRNHRSYDTA
jgi:hypothetical protein